MPININLTQPDGSVPSYHVVQNVSFNVAAGSAYANVSGWLDNTHHALNAPPMSQYVCDISPLLTQAAPSPSGNFGPQVVNVVEQFLVVFTMPNPASTASNPLPNIQSPMYGGIQVA